MCVFYAYNLKTMKNKKKKKCITKLQSIKISSTSTLIQLGNYALTWQASTASFFSCCLAVLLLKIANPFELGAGPQTCRAPSALPGLSLSTPPGLQWQFLPTPFCVAAIRVFLGRKLPVCWELLDGPVVTNPESRSPKKICFSSLHEHTPESLINDKCV